MMNIAFLVNDATDIKPDQTTAHLITEARSRDHRVHVAGVGDLALSADGRIIADVVRLDGGRARVILDNVDMVVLRTNPGRDSRYALHSSALQMMMLLEDRGIFVTNSPRGLQRYASKLCLARLPAWTRPAMIVTSDPVRARAFVDDVGGPCVGKPLDGTQGRDVFLIDPMDSDNVPQMLDVVTRHGPAVVQEFVAEGDEGATRVLVLDGAILEVDGTPAAVRRVPPDRDFRSNVHVGGVAIPAEITGEIRAAIGDVGPLFLRDGLRFVGLDFVGSLIIEVNVFSPGGIPDAARFGQTDFAPVVLSSWERHRAS
ncbi:MAG: glutathione synthase [Myxococcota bacterium]|jgi:glutathione synthase